MLCKYRISKKTVENFRKTGKNNFKIPVESITASQGNCYSACTFCFVQIKLCR